jgi:hypothetical protein
MAKAVMTSLFFFGPFFVLLSMLNLFTREKKKRVPQRMESSPLVQKDVPEQILTQEFLLNKIMTG